MNISININIEKPRKKSEEIIVLPQGSPIRDNKAAGNNVMPEHKTNPEKFPGPGSKMNTNTRSPGLSRRHPGELGGAELWVKQEVSSSSNPGTSGPPIRKNSDLLTTKLDKIQVSSNSINSSTTSVFQRCCVLLRKCHPTKKSSQRNNSSNSHNFFGPKEIEPGVFTIMDRQIYQHILCLNCHLIEMGSAITYFDDTCPQCGRNVKDNTGGFY